MSSSSSSTSAAGDDDQGRGGAGAMAEGGTMVGWLSAGAGGSGSLVEAGVVVGILLRFCATSFLGCLLLPHGAGVRRSSMLSVTVGSFGLGYALFIRVSRGRAVSTNPLSSAVGIGVPVLVAQMAVFGWRDT